MSDRPTEVPEGQYPLIIGDSTHVLIDVKHNGEPFQSRLAHLVSPRIKSGDVTLLPPNVALEVIARYVPYKNNTGRHEEVLLHYAYPIVNISGLFDPGIQGLNQLWTVIHVVCVLWPGELYFNFNIPKSTAEEACLSLLARMRLSSEPHEYARLYWPEPKWACTINSASFWQGYGPFFSGTWIPDLFSNNAFSSPYSFLRCHFPLKLVHENDDVRPGDLDMAQKEVLNVPIYRRYIPQARQVLTFRLADPFCDGDFHTIYRWCNKEYFRKEWFADGLKENTPVDLNAEISEDDLRYEWIHWICNQEQFLLIAEWNEIPFGCVQVYDAKFLSGFNLDDQLRSAFAFHMSIGEESSLEDEWYKIAIQSIGHMLFLLDEGRDLLWTLPTARSYRLIQRLCMSGGHLEKVRHRSNIQLISTQFYQQALVVFPRNRFFDFFPSGPVQVLPRKRY